MPKLSKGHHSEKTYIIEIYPKVNQYINELISFNTLALILFEHYGGPVIDIHTVAVVKVVK